MIPTSRASHHGQKATTKPALPPSAVVLAGWVPVLTLSLMSPGARRLWSTGYCSEVSGNGCPCTRWVGEGCLKECP